MLLAAAASAGAAEAPLPPMPAAALQAALDRQGFGPGLIDNVIGRRTRAALADFREARGISNATDLPAALALDRFPACTNITISQADLDQLGAAPTDWLAASGLPRLACESLPEFLSERHHVSEAYLRALNPHVAEWDSTHILGAVLAVPDIAPRGRVPAAARLVVDCREFRLRALDADGNIVASFPCSIAMAGRAPPEGDLKVAVFAPNPNYTFDPANYPESARAREIGRKLILPPGPNNPVGDYWIGLDRPGFGIHGTPHPETVGSRESHGCFRLTNWDIRRLAAMIADGTPVRVMGLEGE